MNKILIALAAFTTLSFTPVTFAADSVATVNGKEIKQSWVDFITKDALARGQKKSPAMRGAIINELVGTELAYQAAQKQGLHKNADFIASKELANRKMLVNVYLQEFMKKNPVSDADKKAAYAQYKKELGTKEYNARHVLVKTEAEAKAVLEEINKGGNFAKIAKAKSIDPGSKVKGGDLGWFSPAGMVKPFSDAVIKLKKNEVVAAPVQTQFGWHVIKLVNTRATKVPSYEKVKGGLTRTLQQRKIEKLMLGLKEKAKIVVPGTTK